ncbi:MAG: hypothetical protein LUD38_15595, partial [Parabacteroides sp.]|nr:hypothetical protein [Parabacteroides sp.]
MGKMSLKWRVILPIGIILIIGIVTMVTIIALRFSASMQASLDDGMTATAYRYANEIKADMEMALGAVQ